MTIAMKTGSDAKVVSEGQAVTPHKPPEEDEVVECSEPEFPVAELDRLNEMINKTRWVVPVLPKGELEVLLEAAIELSSKGLDTKSEPCQRFFSESLTTSFNKILTDEAVSGWKYEIHKCIKQNTERLIDLCVVKLSQDWFPLLDLLAIAFNPHSKFHCYNASRQSESVPCGVQLADNELFARPPDPRLFKGWLVDLVNRFGQKDGFKILLDRFISGPDLSVSLVAALIRPFGYCYEVLTPNTVTQYFMPIVEFVPKFLDSLSDAELRKESKSDSKNDTLSDIIKALKNLCGRIPNQEEKIKQLEILRLKMILKLLRISSFNGKMNALNEVNKVLMNVSYYTQRTGTTDEEWLTADKMAQWIVQNDVLSIVLRDSLHQPQYVEKLEKIVRFMIKEKVLSPEDLDRIWGAQAGKHEAIVKNVHDLLAKLAWDFSPEQLDHLFKCFQGSWSQASKKQQEKLLELIRRLAEDDKEGVMAFKVLELLWNLAHSDDVPVDIMDQALSAHSKILDYSCSQDRDSQKIEWIHRFIKELGNDKWVLPALKQIKEICCLFSEAPQTSTQSATRVHTPLYRNAVIGDLQSKLAIVMLTVQNLSSYMKKAHAFKALNPKATAETILPDGRYNHNQQVQERLKFLRFLLKDGQLWLCGPQAIQIWTCLAQNACYPDDRENCFKWFGKLMGDEQDLDPDITKQFFESNILQFDPCLLSENGMMCFDRFFKSVNVRDNKLSSKRTTYMMEDVELIGLEYLWRVVLNSPEEVSRQAILLLKDVYTQLGPRLLASQQVIHQDFLASCIDRLKASYDTLTVLERGLEDSEVIVLEVRRMVRVLTVMKEYLSECDDSFTSERQILPLGRAYRGNHVCLLIRLPNQARQVDEIEIWSHTNETLGSVRRQVMNRNKFNSNFKIELYVNGEILEPSEDARLVSQLSLRDKTLLTAKVVQAGIPSSPDSSSDSSAASFDHKQAEENLPGVIMAAKHQYTQFLLKLAALGARLKEPALQQCVWALLQIMPADSGTVDFLRQLCQQDSITNPATKSLEEAVMNCDPAEGLYRLQVLYALLMSAGNPLSEEAFQFQKDFIRCGGISVTLKMMNCESFMKEADLITQRSALLIVMKLAKLALSTAGQAKVNVIAEAFHNNSQSLTESQQSLGTLLQQALKFIPNQSAEYMTRNVAHRLGMAMKDTAATELPQVDTILAVTRIAQLASASQLHLLNNKAPAELCHDDILLASDATEVLTVCLALCPTALEGLSKEASWRHFVLDMVLLAKSRNVRISAATQFKLMVTKCCHGPTPIINLISQLLSNLSGKVKEYAHQSHEYFQLLCHILNYASGNSLSLPDSDNLLTDEIAWLKKIRQNVMECGETLTDDALLEGHLGITKELLFFQTCEKKYQIGCQPGGANLIQEIIEDFVFPGSKLVLQCRRNGELSSTDQAIPVCSTELTVTAALNLLIALCSGCVENLKILVNMLTEMYYSGNEPPLTEWEYLPPIGPRPPRGFVGLKNAGATCYMNSVLQQLFMITPIRTYLLSVEGAADDFQEEDDEQVDVEMPDNEDSSPRSQSEEAPNYNLGNLKQVQAIFAHLACSQLQYYVPRGFWRHFRLMGEPVNLREQHDALEFFSDLVDSLDEALKNLHKTPMLSKIMAGSFADQKICKDCPHRYSREEAFTTLNVDIRNHQNLAESLEQYVKGDLLEGANAYKCEKCDKKVDTVKRMCIKKLPQILAIQLKRFDYDWEKESAIKFNDYFEFPRQFDMEPFTVQGLANREGEIITDEMSSTDGDEKDEEVSTEYKLVGVVVHSGQASGGHYYSYILHRGVTPAVWYKFDDGEVSECKMEDDEEMKNQCFGGEYMGEVFDPMLKRMSYRRQKRWWNAYILFYERTDAFSKDEEAKLVQQINDLSLSNRCGQIKMPQKIEKSVRQQNIGYLHNRHHFSIDYFRFIRQLLISNIQNSSIGDKVGTEIAMLCVQIASKCLFSVGFHIKRCLRGPGPEWYDALSNHLRHSKQVRLWFAQHVLFENPGRLAEYLLESPSAEVRSVFMKIIVFLAHFSLHDGPCNISSLVALDSSATLSDHLLLSVLSLLNKQVSEHGRHLNQYFQLFFMYANLSEEERLHLLKLNVPSTLMRVALDEGPGPAIRYQYAELSKLYSVVSILIRSCDLSSRCSSSVEDHSVMSNAHGEKPLMTIQAEVAQILFSRPSYIKKLIEDSNGSDDTCKLLKFASWENPQFSSSVLTELLWQVAYSYTYELRPYLDLLLHMLLLEDSWQNHRILNALKGTPDDRDGKDGLMDTIQRSKTQYQKRAYLCIKMMVSLFSHCQAARQILYGNGDLKRKWSAAVKWLNEELKRPPYGGRPDYSSYNNWSTPAHSNESSNGYFLERSASASNTLRSALHLCPDDDAEKDTEEVEQDDNKESVEEKEQSLEPVEKQADSGASSPVFFLPASTS